MNATAVLIGTPILFELDGFPFALETLNVDRVVRVVLATPLKTELPTASRQT